MWRELENEVQTAISTEADQLSRVWMIDVRNNPEFGQEVADFILIVLLLLGDLLHGHDLTIGQEPLVHLSMPPFPNQVICSKFSDRHFIKQLSDKK